MAGRGHITQRRSLWFMAWQATNQEQSVLVFTLHPVSPQSALRVRLFSPAASRDCREFGSRRWPATLPGADGASSVASPGVHPDYGQGHFESGAEARVLLPLSPASARPFVQLAVFGSP